MSENILQYTTRIPLQEIAEGIVAEQMRSIADLEAVLPVCSMETNSAQALYRYRRQADRIIGAMLIAMDTACANNNVSADFMLEMIPHHRGAVELLRTALRYPSALAYVPF